ncbi:MAG: type II toxin-antitoxin system VapC family toxin [Desulfobacteraceae bacterium]|nr:MAG: type II toxin-antitoxin system VapC family toxin [Desulfobacteraceae bacterium]
MKKPVVLDSFALLCFFHKEPGWEKVESILSELSAAGEKALLSRINWGEFYYILKRRVGRSRTQEALALLDQLPIEILAVDDELVQEAAEIKAEYPIAYADAFCVATARRFNGQIVTSDPEFKAVEKIVSVIWLIHPLH